MGYCWSRRNFSSSAASASPVRSLPSASLNAARRMQSAAVSIAEKGLAPVHRKAVSNAKRLSKAKR